LRRGSPSASQPERHSGRPVSRAQGTFPLV
jgi:hypothetical protein